MTKKTLKKNTKKTENVKTEQTEATVNKQIDLSELSLIDLIGLQNALPAIIEQAKQSEKVLLREKMIALAAASGFELSELFEEQSVKKKKPKQIGFVKAKYINPNNTEQTWTGRGRKPKWADEYLKQGGELQELLINLE